MTEHSAAGGFEQVNTGRSSQMVYEDLSERIIRGEYLTGEKLPSEKELMLRYDRSHGTVRDGIKMLQAMGMVRIIPGGGAEVISSTDTFYKTIVEIFASSRISMGQIIEFVKESEPRLLSKFFYRIDEESIVKMEMAFEKLELICQSPEQDGIHEQLSRMHLEMIKGMNNPCLTALFSALSFLWIEYVRKKENKDKINTFDTKNLIKTHRRLIDAMRIEDPAIAVKALEEGKSCLFYDSKGIRGDKYTYDGKALTEELYGVKTDSRASLKAYCQILGMIISGQLKGGQKMSAERKLTETLGISRPVLIEALRMLEARGYIERNRGSGTVVRNVDDMGAERILNIMYRRGEITFRHVFEGREICEPVAFQFAARFRKYSDIRQIQIALDEAWTEGRDSIDHYMGYGVNFDCKAAEICGNKVLYWVERISSQFCHDLLGAKLVKLPAHFAQQLMKQIYDEHSDMLSCIAVRDEDAVRQLCERHLKVIADAAF